MTRTASLRAAGLIGALVLVPAAARAQATVGQPAPAFSAPDQTGATRSLDAYKGKWVVLECVNHECPFVKKHYGSGNMQKLQKNYTAKGVVWLSVNSTNRNHAEYSTGARMTAWMQQQGGAPKAVLIDDTSATGRAYAARTTPHMFVIDPAGKIVYAGAIDDKRSANPADIKTSVNHVAVALGELGAGKAVTRASTAAYGCTIKY